MKTAINNTVRYNKLWQSTDIQPPEIWSTWRIIKEISGGKNLEIGPGSFPKIPIKNGHFLDISKIAVSNLEETGAGVFLGSAEK